MDKLFWKYGLIHFDNAVACRKWVRWSTQRLRKSSKRFLTLISVCSIATPDDQWIAFIIIKIVCSAWNLHSFIAIQFIVESVFFGLWSQVYSPFVLLFNCFAILPVPNWNSYLSVTSAVGIAHVCVIVYLFLFCFSSLTPHSRPGSWLYAFRKNTMMLTFSAAPQRLFSERDLVNMITFAIVSRKTGSSFGVPFSDLGLKSDPHLFISTCKPFCVCFPLTSFVD